MEGTSPTQETDSVSWRDLKYFNGEMSEITAKDRITEETLAYKKSYDQAHTDTLIFDDCPEKLRGSGNYPEWHRWLKNQASMAGLRSLQLGKAEAPVKPEEPASTRRWNTYMLEKAWWEGMNHVMAVYMRRTVDSTFQSKIAHCKLVSEAMDIIDKACPPLPIDEAVRRLHSLMACTFDETSAFETFTTEWNRRFLHLDNMRGGFKMDEKQKCVIFWSALGPRFDTFKTALMNFSIAGYGSGNSGKNLDFFELLRKANQYWDMQCVFDERKRKEAGRLDINNKRERQQRKRQRRKA